MKLTFQADVLNHIVAVVAKATKPKDTGIGAENIRIKVDKDKTIFTGTDLEIQLNATVPLKSEQTGEVAIPAQSFSQYLATLGEADKVELEVQDSYLVVKAGNGTARFNVANTKDFPVIEEENLSIFAELPVEEMLKLIKHTVFAALKGDETRPVLNGIFFDGNKEVLTAVSLDTFRMSVHKTKEKPKTKGSFSVTYRALVLLERILRDSLLANIIGDQKITILINKDISLVAFKYGDIVLYVKVIEGTYPDYSSIIPVDFKVSGTVNVPAFMTALRRVGVFAQNSITKQVIFDIREDTLILSSEAQENGDSQQSVAAKFKGEGLPLKIGFQYKFIIEFLNSVDSGSIEIKAINPMSPVLFKPQDDKSYVHVIMPLKL